jgi:hypothetical protein
MSAPIAISVKERRDYVLRKNREDPADQQTIFVLRSLTGGERHAVARQIGDAIRGDPDGDGKTTVSLAPFLDAQRLACEYGLTGWRGLRGEDGNEIPFPGPGRRALDLLDASVQHEIGGAVMQDSKLMPEQVRD